MPAFAEKEKRPQPYVSAKPANSKTAASDKAQPNPSLQWTFGPQAVLQLKRASSDGSEKLAVNTPGDSYEQEADHISAQVMQMPEPQLQRTCACGGGCSKCQAGALDHAHEHVQTKHIGSSDSGQTSAPPLVHEALASPGQPLDAATRAFMEPRFGHDFSRVRVHTDPNAAESARNINALAYTVGHQIIFETGQYEPATSAGKRLMAHELTHVMQQRGSDEVVQRTPAKPQIEIRDARSTDPLGANERRAAASCDIKCGRIQVGRLHAMPYTYHEYNSDPSRSPPIPLSPTATGVGIGIHFFGKAALCNCREFKIIQVVQTTHNAGDKRGGSIVDINTSEANDYKRTHPSASITPYYGDWAKNRHGRAANEIPKPYSKADAGSRVKADHSIYDRPSRNPATDLKDHANLSWEAEAHVVCLRTGLPDKILGGIIWGFSREFDKSTSSYKKILPEPPRCVDAPTKHFTHALSTDIEVPDYDFEGKEKPKKP